MVMTQPPTGTNPPRDSIPPPQITYVDPDGVLWPLTDLTLSNGYICTNIAGISGVPVNFSSIPMVTGGAVPQIIISQPGQIAMGMYLESLGDVNAYMKLLDSFAYSFRTERAGSPSPGYLVVQRQDGSTRQLAVYVTGGVEAAVDEGVAFSTYLLTLNAPDPYWYDQYPTVLQYNLTASGVTGILPLLPINLTPSTVFGSQNVINDGGADTYPIWTFTGPGIPTVQNVSTGFQFSFFSALVSGQQVQVSTVPGNQYAIDISNGNNMWGQIVKNSPRDLWPLIRGTNQISIQMSGATSSSAIQLQYTRRWLRP
jgi:hypothetical protein